MDEIYNKFGLSIHVEFDIIGFCALTFQGLNFHMEDVPVVYWCIDINYE